MCVTQGDTFGANLMYDLGEFEEYESALLLVEKLIRPVSKGGAPAKECWTSITAFLVDYLMACGGRYPETKSQLTDAVEHYLDEPGKEKPSRRQLERMVAELYELKEKRTRK